MIYIRDVKKELEYDFLNKVEVDNSSFKELLRNAYSESICKKKSFKEIVMKNKDNTEGVLGYYIISMCRISLPKDVVENFDDFQYFSVNLDLIYIHTPYRHRGIGKAVINYIISEAKNVSNMTGCRFLSLDALNGLENLYGGLGFNLSNIERNYSATKMMFYDFRDAILYEEYSNP